VADPTAVAPRSDPYSRFKESPNAPGRRNRAILKKKHVYSLGSVFQATKLENHFSITKISG
jgi:hypothetical protein